MKKLFNIMLLIIACLFIITSCSASKIYANKSNEKLPYKEWKFNFIYPKALPAWVTRVILVNQERHTFIYRAVDGTDPSDISIERWSEVLGSVQAVYNKAQTLPTTLRICWDSIIDKKNYETLIRFNQETWQQMTTLYADTYRPGETYYRKTMIIGLAPEGKVRVWLGARSDPAVLQKDAEIETVAGDKRVMCKGITRANFTPGYDKDTEEFIKGKKYPYGEW